VIVTSRSIDRCITTLRSKSSRISRPKHVQTIRDIGYRFETGSEAHISLSSGRRRRLGDGGDRQSAIWLALFVDPMDVKFHWAGRNPMGFHLFVLAEPGRRHWSAMWSPFHDRESACAKRGVMLVILAKVQASGDNQLDWPAAIIRFARGMSGPLPGLIAKRRDQRQSLGPGRLLCDDRSPISVADCRAAREPAVPLLLAALTAAAAAIAEDAPENEPEPRSTRSRPDCSDQAGESTTWSLLFCRRRRHEAEKLGGTQKPGTRRHPRPTGSPMKDSSARTFADLKTVVSSI